METLVKNVGMTNRVSTPKTVINNAGTNAVKKVKVDLSGGNFGIDLLGKKSISQMSSGLGFLSGITFIEETKKKQEPVLLFQFTKIGTNVEDGLGIGKILHFASLTQFKEDFEQLKYVVLNQDIDGNKISEEDGNNTLAQLDISENNRSSMYDLEHYQEFLHSDYNKPMYDDYTENERNDIGLTTDMDKKDYDYSQVNINREVGNILKQLRAEDAKRVKDALEKDKIVLKALKFTTVNTYIMENDERIQRNVQFVSLDMVEVERIVDEITVFFNQFIGNSYYLVTGTKNESRYKDLELKFIKHMAHVPK